jgi:beta-xylosidase
MVNGEKAAPEEKQRIALTGNKVYVKAEGDFRNRTDKGYFYYSTDNKTWTKIGNTLQMEYTLPHFIGYRFGLFNWASATAGGSVDFDWYRISDQISVN